jgi:hypothetical protein
MSPCEVCFLIGPGGAVLWADVGSGPFALPDSRARWEAIWARRVELVEIAHSHPLGPLAFSQEDETTMAALRAALGRPDLRFSVLAPGGMVLRPGARDEDTGADLLLSRDEEPWWAELLRRASGMMGGVQTATQEGDETWPS